MSLGNIKEAVEKIFDRQLQSTERLRKLLFLTIEISKKTLWLEVLLFFVLLGLSFPLYNANAWLGPLGGIADAIGKAIGSVIAGFLIMIPAAILGFAGFILQWSIDPHFINVPGYTKGAVVDVGWPVVRDLANMAIVLVLVAIGLATALRIEEYYWRKTLPRLIVVALLINFSPVLLGLIVDFCNIIMYFFLDGLMGVDFITRIFASMHSIVASDLGGFNFFNPVQQYIFFFKVIIIWIFYILLALIFLLYAFLFIIRRIAIWMLVIFSPIAFVAYILPDTKKLFSLWWNQFWNWSIIGVLCAFFLYLGDHIIGAAAAGGFTGDAPTGVGGWFTRPLVTMVEQLMPYVVAGIFLLFGFFVALSTSAAVGSGIVGGAQRGTRLLTKKGGLAARDATVNWARGTETGKGWEKGVTKWMERTGMVAPGTYETVQERLREKATKTLKTMRPEQLVTEVIEKTDRTEDDRRRKADAILILAEKGKVSDKVRPHLPIVQQMGRDVGQVLERRPDWAPDIGQNMAAVIEKMEPADVRKIQAEAFQDWRVVFNIMRDARKFNEIERRGKAVVKNQIVDTLLNTPPPIDIGRLPVEEQRALIRSRLQMINNPNWPKNV